MEEKHEKKGLATATVNYRQWLATFFIGRSTCFSKLQILRTPETWATHLQKKISFNQLKSCHLWCPYAKLSSDQGSRLHL